MVKKISICLPVLNGAETIRRTLDSIQAQDYKDYELLIFDGGSTDGTLEIYKEYGLTYHQVPSYVSPDGIPALAINKMTGNIFCIIGCDDEYLPGAFTKVAETLDPLQPEWCYAETDIMEGGVKRFSMGEKDVTMVDMLGGMQIAGIAAFFTKKVFAKHGVQDNSYTNASDYEFLIRLFSRGCLPKKMDQKVVVYHITGHNMGMSPEAAASAERIKTKYRAIAFNV